MAQLTDIPLELIIQILNNLDFRSILLCRQLNRLFKDIVDTDAYLQYKIELAVAGMEDGPPSSATPSERLQLLREHRKAWNEMRFNSSEDIPMSAGGVWELFGGVLAQGIPPKGMSFNQLPSKLRGIESKAWALHDLGVKIRDFGMDPASDLLVLVVKPPPESTTFSIHLRSMATGKPHPAASHAILEHTVDGLRFSFTIQPSGDYLGVFFESAEEEIDSELVVWNWKTGKVEMVLALEAHCPFAFLTDRHVILSLVREHDEHESEVVLAVADFKSASPEKVHCGDVEFTCEFQYPALRHDAQVLAVTLRADPSPGWVPHHLSTPFNKDRNERLLVITLWAQIRLGEHNHVQPLLHFVPSSTILRYLGQRTEGELPSITVPWEKWGPSGSRMLESLPRHSPTWVCYVHGMTFVRHSPIDKLPRKLVQILDFNQVAVKRALADPLFSLGEVICEPTRVSLQLFQGDVTTSLPFQLKTVTLPPWREFGSPMVSEDSIVMVYSEIGRRYRVLTF
ncbi:hypothetical protein BXZ70DRAFT_943596 [Cristinia sonorae]|uniref:F-box domain-containing protein n=1 Tax=Cristinia sonorae TaxID=1940300 RepID=A0A8K0UMG7_9AGAR|nr:hypothetical protein BXZ70DRAFT_943596 [Cristinia sonorae]